MITCVTWGQELSVMKAGGTTGLGVMEGGTLDGAVYGADVKGRLEQVHERTEGDVPRRSTDESLECVCCTKGQQNGVGRKLDRGQV